MKHHSRASRFFKAAALTTAILFSLGSCRLLAFSLLFGGYDDGYGTTHAPSSGSGTSSTGSSSGGTGTSTGGTTTTGTTTTGGGTSSGTGGTTTTTATRRTLPISGKALSWGEVLQFDRSYFADFVAGSQIIVNETNTDQYSSQFKMYAPVVNSGWVPLSGGTVTNASLNGDGVITSGLLYNSPGTIVYTVTATEAENLKNYGMYLHGGGMTVNSIQLIGNGTVTATTTGTSTGGTTTTGTSTGSGRSTSGRSTTVHSGNADLGNWAYFTIDASRFQNAQAGSVLTLTTARSATVPNPGYRNLRLYGGSTWQPLSGGALSGAGRNGDTIVVQSTGSTVAYTLTDSDAALLRASGLIVQGYGLAVSKVTLSGTSSAAGGTAAGTTATASNGNAAAAPSGTPYARHGTLSVSGANLVDKNGRKYQLYGMSTHGLSWYPEYVSQAAFQTLRDDWNTNCVRLVLYPRDYNGYLTGGNQAQLRQLVYNGIDYATNLGLYVIVDWHVHNYNPNETLSEAIAFFREVSARYKGHDNVLYEICNEPTNSDWNTVIKPYAEAVIPVIRANDSNAIVLVGTNTWSQDLEGPLGNRLSYTNVMYTFHFYAHTHTDVMRQRLQVAVNAGLPVFITEFGTCDSSGNGGYDYAQSQQWFSILRNYGLSHMNWSLCNKAETASAIRSDVGRTSGWAESDLTDSGRLVRAHFKSLSQ